MHKPFDNTAKYLYAYFSVAGYQTIETTIGIYGQASEQADTAYLLKLSRQWDNASCTRTSKHTDRSHVKKASQIY